LGPNAVPQAKPMNRTAKRHQKMLARKAAKRNRRAPSPQSPDLGSGATLETAMAQHQAGRLDQAKRLYTAVLSQEPLHPVALHFLGIVAYQQGDPNQAIASIDWAIAIRPDYAEAHGNRGLALYALGRLDEAMTSYRNAIAIESNHAEAHSNLGNAFRDLGKLEEAVASYRRALAIKSDFADAHTNLGAALNDLGILDEAVASCRKALAIKPDCAEAYRNLSAAFQGLGKSDEAMAGFRKAIVINPDYAGAHSNLGLLLLNSGKLQEGLDEHEWRWRDPKFAANARIFSRPLWDGLADLTGRTILLWGEQGPQDMTIWSSCLPHISRRAGRCILECPAKLVSLFARSFPDVEVRPENRIRDTERVDFDFHLPMGSLFRHFLPELTEASGVQTFLTPDPERIAFWRNRLEELGPGPYVGISWKSPVMTHDRAPNYTQIADWVPVFAIRDAVFVNLQSKDGDNDLAKAKRDLGVTIHDFEDLDHYNDLDEVAALAGALDVAISVSTAVAAITAGVGTPTWVISWRQSSWNNFLLAPRGPSVRQFERNTGETWDAVFKSIAESLAARTGRG
jgi:tetratricopeptide (TPR) repeat protein